MKPFFICPLCSVFDIARIDNIGKAYYSSVIAIKYPAQTLPAISKTSVLQQEETNKKAGVRISPVPALTVLSVYTNGLEKDKALQVTVFSTAGIEVTAIYTYSSNQCIQVDLLNQAARVYFLRARCGATLLTRQFIKQ